MNSFRLRRISFGPDASNQLGEHNHSDQSAKHEGEQRRRDHHGECGRWHANVVDISDFIKRRVEIMIE